MFAAKTSAALVEKTFKERNVAKLLSESLASAVAEKKPQAVSEAISYSVSIGVARGLLRDLDQDSLTTESLQKVAQDNKTDSSGIETQTNGAERAAEMSSARMTINQFVLYLNRNMKEVKRLDSKPHFYSKSPFYTPIKYSKKVYLQSLWEQEDVLNSEILVMACFYIDSYLKGNNKFLATHEVRGLMVASIYLAHRIQFDSIIPANEFAMIEDSVATNTAYQSLYQSYYRLRRKQKDIYSLVYNHFKRNNFDHEKIEEYLALLNSFSGIDDAISKVTIIENETIRGKIRADLEKLKQEKEIHERYTAGGLGRLNRMTSELNRFFLSRENKYNLMITPEQFALTEKKLKETDLSVLLKKMSELHLRMCAPVKSIEMTPVTSSNLPDIDLCRYLLRIDKNCFFSKEIWIKALILIDRYVLTIPMNCWNIHKLWATALSFLHEKTIPNYSEIIGITSAELDAMKDHFIQVIKNDFYISDTTFCGYERELEAFNLAPTIMNATATTQAAPVTPVFNNPLRK